ncbi:Uncharacterized protein APZ42_000469, partial [Daphnia magna]
LYTDAKPKTGRTFFQKSNKTVNAPVELSEISPFTADLTQPNTYTPHNFTPSHKRPTRSTLNYVPLEQVKNPEAILRSKKIRIQNTDNVNPSLITRIANFFTPKKVTNLTNLSISTESSNEGSTKTETITTQLSTISQAPQITLIPESHSAYTTPTINSVSEKTDPANSKVLTNNTPSDETNTDQPIQNICVINNEATTFHQDRVDNQ